MIMASFNDEPTMFRELLGDTSKIRVLEYLLEGRELDHSLTDIADGAGINRITLFRMWREILSSEVVVHTRIIGNAKLYKLNLKNIHVKLLAELFDHIIASNLRLEKNKEKKISV